MTMIDFTCSMCKRPQRECVCDKVAESFAANSDEPECWRKARAQGHDCYFCSGEACGTCGAGLWGLPFGERCEHDVMDRHKGPYCADGGR